MARYALYVRRPRAVHWDLREVFDSQEAAEQAGAGLVQGPSDLEYGDDPERVDEAIVVAAGAGGGEEAPAQLSADHVTPVVSRFAREGLAG
jgi:hypothetical protein